MIRFFLMEHLMQQEGGQVRHRDNESCTVRPHTHRSLACACFWPLTVFTKTSISVRLWKFCRPGSRFMGAFLVVDSVCIHIRLWVVPEPTPHR